MAVTSISSPAGLPFTAPKPLLLPVSRHLTSPPTRPAHRTHSPRRYWLQRRPWIVFAVRRFPWKLLPAISCQNSSTPRRNPPDYTQRAQRPHQLQPHLKTYLHLHSRSLCPRHLLHLPLRESPSSLLGTREGQVDEQEGHRCTSMTISNTGLLIPTLIYPTPLHRRRNTSPAADPPVVRRSPIPISRPMRHSALLPFTGPFHQDSLGEDPGLYRLNLSTYTCRRTVRSDPHWKGGG